MQVIEHWKNLSLENIIEEYDGVTYVEEWKWVNGFENIYSISSFGRIKSHSREINVCGVVRLSEIEKIRKLSITRKGYLSIRLCMGGKKFNYLVHRLVGIHYIQNPDNLPEINHLKGFKKDNRVHQLEWSTHLDNCKHCYDTGIYVISEKQKKAVSDKNRLYCGNKHYMSKLVLDTLTGVYYDTAIQAANSVPMPTSTLYENLNGRKNNTTKFIYV